MKQLGLGLNLSIKRTRKREFLDDRERVVPWPALVQVVEPCYPRAKTGRPPFGIETLLRVHCLQPWFALSELAMEETLAVYAMRAWSSTVTNNIAQPAPSTESRRLPVTQ